MGYCTDRAGPSLVGFTSFIETHLIMHGTFNKEEEYLNIFWKKNGDFLEDQIVHFLSFYLLSRLMHDNEYIMRLGVTERNFTYTN